MYCQEISSVVNSAKTVYHFFVSVSKPEGKQSKAQAWEGCDAWRGRSSVTRPPLSPTALHCHIQSTSAAIFTHWHILKISSRISKSSTWFVFVSLKDSVCYENLIIGPIYWGIYFAVNVKCATFCFRAFAFTSRCFGAQGGGSEILMPACPMASWVWQCMMEKPIGCLGSWLSVSQAYPWSGPPCPWDAPSVI